MHQFAKLTLAIFSSLFISITLISCNDQGEKNVAKTMVEEKIKTPEPERLLRHVVLFNFNDDATPSITKEIEQKFSDLKEKISAIHSFEWGINNSPEGLDKGLTHCFFVTFLSEEDRSTYLPHSDHQEFVKFIGPYVEDVTVVDYWTGGN